uniref:Ciliary neurotrophic factor n=1 Tax=Cyprinodon variegatus TaxID=28743 RepID=A0A3Q2GB87_CYPVA
MAEQEEQPLTRSEAPVPGSTQTGRAVALARLLQRECSQLLQLYKERETFLLDHAPDGGRMVSLSTESEEPSAEEQVQLLHSALRQCLGLLHCLIKKEEEEWGKLEQEYETLKMHVKTRLERLLYTTRDLVGNEDGTLEVTPDHQCNEEVDGPFGLKMWTYNVLLELIHWADHAEKTLHVLHTEKGGTEEI